MDNNFKAISQLRFWCQKVLPLVYDDALSYYEVLCKIQLKINELIMNNNTLPQLIVDLITEMLRGDEFQQIMAEMLSDLFLNVKYPPLGIPKASGDGTTDDTLSIQGCIDYAYTHGGKSVYIPSGKYLVDSLTLKNNTSLTGSDRYTTKLVLKGGASSSLIIGNPSSFTISNLELDGNSENQVNATNVIDLSTESAIIYNAIITGGVILLNCTCENDLQLSSIIFNKAIKNACVFSGGGTICMENAIMNALSSLDGESYIILNNSNSIIRDVTIKGSAIDDIIINGNSNDIQIQSTNGSNIIDNGNNNNITVIGVMQDTKFTGNVTSDIMGNRNISTTNDTLTVSGERNVSTRIDSLTVENEANYTFNGTRNDSIIGTFTTEAQELIETITNSKIINAKDIKCSGNDSIEFKTKNFVNEAQNLTETVNVSKNVNAKEVKYNVEDGIEFNANDVIINSTNPLTYKIPNQLPNFMKGVFDSVPFSDGENEYEVLVASNRQFYENVINVKDYGAEGNNVNDDTEAIQRAVDVFNLNSGTLYFPKGTYKISGGFNLTNNGVVMGDGVINAGDVTSELPYVFRVSHEQIVINNLKIKGNENVSYGIEVRNSYCIIRGCFIYDCNYNIGIINTSMCFIYCNYIVSPFTTGVRITSVNGDTGDNGIFYNTFDTSHSSNSAIFLQSGGGLRIIGNKILNFNVGIDIQSTANTSVLTVAGNSIENQGEYGIRLANAGEYSKCSITGNQFGGRGIAILNNTSFVICSGNTMQGMNTENSYGFILQNCSNINIVNNQLYYVTGIALSYSAVQNLVIKGNTLDNTYKTAIALTEANYQHQTDLEIDLSVVKTLSGATNIFYFTGDSSTGGIIDVMVSGGVMAYGKYIVKSVGTTFTVTPITTDSNITVASSGSIAVTGSGGCCVKVKFSGTFKSIIKA